MRLIDADNLYDDVLHDGDYENDTINHFLDMVSAQPDVDAEPVRHGKWVEAEYYDDIVYKCSACKEEFALIDGTPKDNLYNYCPHCGAKMDLK